MNTKKQNPENDSIHIDKDDSIHIDKDDSIHIDKDYPNRYIEKYL
jgi:hypothetical protein